MKKHRLLWATASLLSILGLIISIAMLSRISEILTDRGLNADATKTAGWTSPTELVILTLSCTGIIVFPFALTYLYKRRLKVSA